MDSHWKCVNKVSTLGNIYALMEVAYAYFDSFSSTCFLFSEVRLPTPAITENLFSFAQRNFRQNCKINIVAK